MRPAPIFHVITSLNLGGAETMLCQVLEHTDRSRFAPKVISLRPEGPLAPRVRAAGVPLHNLDMHGWRSGLRGLRTLRRLLREERPALVQTWMYHANLLGSLAVVGITPRPPLVWNIAHSTMPPGSAKIMSQLLRRALAPVSRCSPDGIIICAHDAIREHERIGYAPGGMTYISNGVDCERFKPDETARLGIRRELGIPAGARVIGITARNNPQKDYPNFFAAVRLLQTTHPDVHFVACGSGVTSDDPQLAAGCRSCVVPENVHLIGPRRDVPAVLNAFDLSTLSSVCEAQPLSLCEALACGVPCVATEVGDSADVIGPIGSVVPARNPEALANAWRAILSLDEDEFALLRKNARRRAEERFSLGKVVGDYESFYDSVMARTGGRGKVGLVEGRLTEA